MWKRLLGPVAGQWRLDMCNQVGHVAFLKTRQNSGTPNVPQPFRYENLTQQLPVVCNCEVIKAYEGSARSLVSQLLPLLPPRLFSVLPRNPSCGDAANCLREPANKNSSSSLPHQSKARACNGITKILQDSRTAGVTSPAVLPIEPSLAQQKLHTNVFVL